MDYDDRIKIIKNAVNKIQNSESSELDFNSDASIDDLTELELLEEDSRNE